MLESPDYFFRVREIGRLRQTILVVDMFLDPAHQLAVSMRIVRKSKDVYTYAAESRDVSVTCWPVEAATEAVASC